MDKRIFAPYTGKCPKTGVSQRRTIEYVELYMSGNPSPFYKKMNYVCEYQKDCSFKDEYGRCPLMKQSPDAPN